LADHDPAKPFCYLPFADRKDYWKEGCSIGKLSHPLWDWDHSYPNFIKTWANKADDFRFMKVAKNKPVSSCAECIRFSGQILAAKSREDVARIRRLRKKHFLEVQAERAKYHEARERVEDGYLCMIIDGMDQKKTSLPRAPGSRAGDETESVKTRIIGVKVHGYKKYFYIVPPDFPHDSNITISLLLQTICLWTKETGGPWPKYLHIQMDNTCSDNKTQVMLAAFMRMVEAELMAKVQFGFLPVGHTHEDIDACFARIASYLRKTVCSTFQQLADGTTDAFKDGEAVSVV